MEDDDKPDTPDTDETPKDESKDEPLGDGGKRALEAERKARREAEKRASAAEAKIKAAEDAGKTDAERREEQLADLTRRAEAAEATAMRYEVASEKGLTPAQARRLVGTTREELESDADELRADLGIDNEGKKNAGRQRPQEDLRGGASNRDDDDEVDPDAIADGILSKTAF